MTEQEIAALEAAAKAATPGPWYSPNDYQNEVFAPERHATALAKCDYGAFGSRLYDAEDVANARFIAAANPATIQSLIASRRALAARVAELEAAQGSVWALAMNEAADECERMMMYPGGRCEAPAHENVWKAAAAIRALAPSVPEQQPPTYRKIVDTMNEVVQAACEVCDSKDRSSRLALALDAADSLAADLVKFADFSGMPDAAALPAAGSQEPQFTEKQIAAGARFMSDSSADVCNVNREDNWKLYGDDFTAEFKGALAAAISAAPIPQAAMKGEQQ